MSVSVNYSLEMTARETLETGVDAAQSAMVVHTAFNEAATLNASSTPPATKCVFDSGALTAGAATIDLTSLTGVNGATVDMTGLKVQLFRFKNTGAANMTIGEGASNGYELLGNAWTLIVPPSGVVMFYCPDTAPDVSGTTKTIDVSGTGTQTYELSIVAG